VPTETSARRATSFAVIEPAIPSTPSIADHSCVPTAAILTKI
jgi:hypothetical protein